MSRFHGARCPLAAPALRVGPSHRPRRRRPRQHTASWQAQTPWAPPRAGLVFGLLEDLVESITISECEGVFTYLEDHAAALGRPRAKASGKHHMLRTCNQLLRRLSKGHNAVLCGRILIFLARLLPLSDRSGINLQARLAPALTFISSQPPKSSCCGVSTRSSCINFVATGQFRNVTMHRAQAKRRL